MPASVVKSYAEKVGVSVEDAEKHWTEAKKKAEEEGFKEGSTRFYKYTMSIFKKMLQPDDHS